MMEEKKHKTVEPREKYSARVNANCYHKFVRTHPQHAQHHLGMKDHARILNAFHQDMIQEIITNRYGVDLPLKMGNLSIVAYKLLKRIPDFYFPGVDKTNPPPLTNTHTDGLQCKIQYSNHSRRYRLQDKPMWKFRAVHNHTQAVSQAFRQNHRFYIQTHSAGQVRTRRTIQRIRQMEENQLKDFMENYDEFDF